MSLTQLQLLEIYQTYFPRVFGYFLRRLEVRQDVEDLTSLVMLSFIQTLQSQEIEQKEGYLWQIARNQLANFLRNKSKIPVTILYEEKHGEIESNQDLSQNLSLEKFYSQAFLIRRQKLLDCCKKEAKEEDYQLLEAVYLEEKSAAQIAREQNLEPATVRKRLSRIVAKLRQKCRQIWLENL